MMSIKRELNSIGGRLKEGLKKGYTKSKEGVKRVYEEFRIISDPKKATFTYKKTFYSNINVDLKEDDHQFKKWRRWAEDKFGLLGYSFQLALITKDTMNRVDSVSFDFRRKIDYDGHTKRYWQTRLNRLLTRWWEDKAVPKRFWEEDYEVKRWWEEQEKESPPEAVKRPEAIETIVIEGYITFFIDYEEKSVVCEMVIDLKKPEINDIAPDIRNNLIRLANTIAGQLTVILYDQITDRDIELMAKQIEAEIPESDIKQEFHDILEEMRLAIEDDVVTDREIDNMVKQIRDIPDKSFQDGMLRILERLKKEEDTKTKRDLWIQIQELMDKAIKKYGV